MKDNLEMINIILNVITLLGGLWVTYVFYWIWNRERRQWELFQKLNELIDKLENKKGNFKQ